MRYLWMPGGTLKGRRAGTPVTYHYARARGSARLWRSPGRQGSVRTVETDGREPNRAPAR